MPAIDDILFALHSVFELVTLLASLPWEFCLYFWHRSSTWFLSFLRRSPTDMGDHSSQSPFNLRLEDQDTCDLQKRLRPRVDPDGAHLMEGHQTAQAVLQKIDEAQERVRIRTRAQFAVSSHGHQKAVVTGAPLRTRRHLLEQVATETRRSPGSKSTSVLHFDPAATGQGPKSFQHDVAMPAISPFGEFHNTERTESTFSRPIKRTGQEIWYPPLSSFEDPGHDHPPLFPRQAPERTPSPVYPPLPAAYIFTPRANRHQSLPPHAPSISPVRRRIVSEGTTHELIDPSEFQTDRPQTGPSTFLESVAHDSREPENGQDFQVALDPSIHLADMDVDTETLSTGDGSSAKEQSTDENGFEIIPPQQENMGEITPKVRNKQKKQELASNGKKGRGQERPVFLRRSTRSHDKTTTVERDEFGFTINSNQDSADGTSTTHTRPSRKKPLARTKPALKSTPEEVISEESSDEESIKKKRRLKTDKAHKATNMVDELKGSPAQIEPFLREGQATHRTSRHHGKRVGGRLPTKGGRDGK